MLDDLYDAHQAAGLLGQSPTRLKGWHERRILKPTKAKSLRRCSYSFKDLIAARVMLELRASQTPVIAHSAVHQAVKLVQRHRGGFAGWMILVGGDEVILIGPGEGQKYIEFYDSHANVYMVDLEDLANEMLDRIEKQELEERHAASDTHAIAVGA